MAEEEVKDVQEQNQEQQQQEQKVDALAEFKDSDGNFDAAKIQKLADDKKYLRQQISKLKQLPESVEEYGKNFVLDSKFDEFVSNEENKKKIDTVFEKLDKLSLEKGLSVERNNDMRRFVLDELVASKAIDITPNAKKEEMAQKIVAERNSAIQNVIGDVSDMKNWDDQLYDWLKTFCNNSAEFEAHKRLAETNATWALSLNKIRQAMMGNRIPMLPPEASFSQESWDKAFHNASRDEQDRLLKERAEILTKGKH